MGTLLKHWRRMLVTLIPLVFGLLHADGVLHLDVLQRLDDIIYDARLRATMPRTRDERVVIVDIDEKSLAEVGRWPWSRDHLAQLVEELFERQKIAVVGFDVVFAEFDDSSGLKRLRQLAQNELRDQPAFATRLDALQATLDYDARFAKSLEKRPVVLGYYLTSDRDGRKSGTLPAPVLDRSSLGGRRIDASIWNGYGANIDPLARAAPIAGFFNAISESDGVIRSIPLLAEYEGRYYESLSLAMFRTLLGLPAVRPGFPEGPYQSSSYQGLQSVLLDSGGRQLAVPVDHRVSVLVPFRGFGGVNGGSYRYISAADLVAQRVPAESLKGKIVLVGTTAPGLLDLRVSPVGEVYPGVEMHANVISGLLDDNIFVKPDLARDYEVMTLIIAGLVLAIGLPLLTALRAVVLSVLVLAALVGANLAFYVGSGLVLPLASTILMTLTAFALNMSYGYFVESRSKRELANLFGTYVPPELVDEMVRDPDSYSMKATNRELTVMFCDMRGFTKLSEQMEPTRLQQLLTDVFSRLTKLIQGNRGTVDKYMGDCVMAFWGAPVDSPDHAQLAVKTAMSMAQAVLRLNEEHRERGLPEIGIGIGLNTGTMCVGNMGSDIRRSYTVIGDAVNLGSRLEGLSKTYGVEIVVSESTRRLAQNFSWQELDKVRVKGKDQAVAIFSPRSTLEATDEALATELKIWGMFLKAYRAQDWDQCHVQLLNLERINAEKYLYRLYAERVASMQRLPFDPAWDGATNFETK
jgi:adenylate cyclase